MTLTLAEVARLVDGELCGDGGIPIIGAATIRDAREGDITLADDRNLVGKIADCQAAAVLVPEDTRPERFPHIAVRDVRESFAKIVSHFRPPRTNEFAGVSASARVSRTAIIGTNVTILDGVSVGDDVEIGAGTTVYPGVCIMDGCKIGENVTLFPNVVLYENTVVGARTTIHAGAVIGAYGFGYDTRDGKHIRSVQLGYVDIGEDVEIGAATTIDRGTYGPTVIGEGTKIDNQVMVAHNCRIGKHNVICSQVGIAGSTTTGDYVVMAGQVGVRDHVHIGDGATLGAKAGIMNNIPAGETHVGCPAPQEKEQMTMWARIYRLQKTQKQLKDLQKQVDQLTARLEGASH